MRSTFGKTSHGGHGEGRNANGNALDDNNITNQLYGSGSSSKSIDPPTSLSRVGKRALELMGFSQQSCHQGPFGLRSSRVAPSQKVLTIRFNPETQARPLDALQWGLVPYWAKDPKIAYRTINGFARCT